MTLTIATGLVGCGQKSTSEDSAITFKAGTYEATAKGHNADLKLSVTYFLPNARILTMARRQSIAGIEVTPDE